MACFSREGSAGRYRGFCTAAGFALGASILTLLLFAPRFWTWTGLQVPDKFLHEQPEIHRAHFLLAQLEDPWRKIPGLERTSDLVIEWRLLFPVVGHYLHLSPTVFLALPSG